MPDSDWLSVERTSIDLPRDAEFHRLAGWGAVKAQLKGMMLILLQ